MNKKLKQNHKLWTGHTRVIESDETTLFVKNFSDGQIEIERLDGNTINIPLYMVEELIKALRLVKGELYA